MSARIRYVEEALHCVVTSISPAVAEQFLLRNISNRPLRRKQVDFLEMFSRKDRVAALRFMDRLYSGESLVRTDVEFLLRHAMIDGSTKAHKLTVPARLRMTIKAWNWLRRGNWESKAYPQVFAITSRDTNEVLVL